MSQPSSFMSEKKRALIQSMFNKEGIAPKANRIPTAPRSNGAIFPASYAQQRLWFFHQLEPLSAAYNMPLAFRLKGPLDVDLLKESIRLTVERHESLRTTFRFTENQLFQVVDQDVRLAPLSPPFPGGERGWGRGVSGVDLDIPMDVLAACSAADADAEIKRLAAENAPQPFDLASGPPIHIRLVKVDDTDHVLLICVHHIVFDGVSIGILTNDLCTIYEALAKSLPIPLTKPALQYGDYAHWEQMIDRTDDLRYWRETLSGTLPVLELPRDHNRPAEPTFYAGYVQTELDEPAVEALRDITRSEGTTLFTVLLAGFHLLLSRYTNVQDIVTGTTISARNRSELNDVIGCFVNLLSIRTKIDNSTFREYVSRVHSVVTDAYAHQDTPFDQIVRELRPDRDLNMSPIVQVVFESGNIGLTAPKLSDVAIYPIWTDVPATVKFDLGVTVADLSNRVLVTFEYDTDLFDESTMSRMAQHYRSLVTNAGRRPDDNVASLDMLTTAERNRILYEWNATSKPSFLHPSSPLSLEGRGAGGEGYPESSCNDSTVHNLFEQQAFRTPEKTAVSCDGVSRSYAQLNNHAGRLARELTSRGAGPGRLVAVCLPRGLDVMTALLGVLKTGAAYLPLDHSHPQERLRALAVNANALLVITDKAHAQDLQVAGVETMTVADGLPCEAAGEQDLASASPDDRIYAIYTSGSTGAPKAAQVLHSGFTNLVEWYLDEFGINDDDRFLVISSLAFDLTQKNLFAPLVMGAEIVMYPSASYDPDDIVDIIERRGITVINCTPSAFYPIIKACNGRFERLRTLRYIFLGGEPIATTELCEWVKSTDCNAAVVNTYGPTECTDVSAYYRLTADDYAKVGSPPIGRPVDNVTMYVLDADLRPVPVGVRGELYIGGIGVGPGYLGRQELTAEKFVADPFSGNDGGRIYRTGDMARYQSDGAVVYMGREDDQVKIRGYRIELGEIEAILRDHPAVEQCAIGVHKNRHGTADLVCYTVTKAPISPPELADYLGRRLPKYMVPSFYVSLDALPMMPNGKLDQKSLPPPQPVDREQAEAYTAPRTLVESRLCDVWQDVLGIENVGIHDNFFELGGHSLLAAQAIGRTRSLFGIDIPLQTLFDASTIASFAPTIEARLSPHSLEPVEVSTIPPAVVDAPIPLSFTQERFWLLSRSSNADQYYHVNVQIDVEGGLDIDGVHFALDKVVREHAILRMNCVPTEGGVRGLATSPNTKREGALTGRRPNSLGVYPRGVREGGLLALRVVTSVAGSESGVFQAFTDHRTLNTVYVDLGEFSDDERERQYAARIVPEMNTPFDLTSDDLLRGAIIRWTPSQTRLLLVFHRIVADGRTLDIFFEDFAAAYAAQMRGEPITLQKSPVTYADYASWQRSAARDGSWNNDLAYWRNQLKDAPGLLRIPIEFEVALPPDPVPSPPLGKGWLAPTDKRILTCATGTPLPLGEGAGVRVPESGPFPILTYPFAVPYDVFMCLQDIRREQNTSLNTVLLTAFGIALHRLTGSPDMLIGCTTACRSLPELTWVAGPCSNVVMMRLNIDVNLSFIDLLNAIHRTTIDAYEHEELPFLLLMQTLFGENNPQASSYWNPRNLYNVSMVHHHPRDNERGDSTVEGNWPDFSGWTATTVDPNLLDMRSYMDLHLSTIETVNNLCGYVEYRPDLFPNDRIKDFIESYVAILTAVAREKHQEF